MRRRQRQPDSLASSAAIRGVLSELKECCPSLSTLPDREFHKLLQSIRHLETYSATDTKRGRPTIFERELLDDAGSHLKAILFRNSGDRISIQTFIGHYLPILDWPEDVVRALERGDLSRLEATQVARLTAYRLGGRQREAAKIRAEIIDNHVRVKGSQTALREKVREALGELTLVSSEKMTEAVQQIDRWLRIDPKDRRHLFYEKMKELFFALREFNSEDLDETDIGEIMTSADLLSGTIHSIKQRIKARSQAKKPIEGFFKEKEPEQDQRPVVEKDAQGRIIYRFK